MEEVDSYTMQKKLKDEIKNISLKTKASDVILEGNITLDAKIEEVSSILNDILDIIIDAKINKANEELYDRIMNSINNTSE